MASVTTGYVSYENQILLILALQIVNIIFLAVFYRLIGCPLPYGSGFQPLIPTP
jgi:hypothetical protein